MSSLICFFPTTPNFESSLLTVKGFPKWNTGKESVCQCRRYKRCGFDPWVAKISWRRKWLATPVFLPGKSHGQRSLVSYSPWGHKELDTTERLVCCDSWGRKESDTTE